MRKVRGSFLFLDQTKERRKNSVEGGKEKKRKEKKKGGKERKGEKKKNKEERKERRGKTKERIKNPYVEEKGKRKEKCSDSWCSDGWKSIDLELKLAYSTRATSRCQKQKEVGFSPTLVPLNLRAINGCMVQPQPWD